jgi:hypothetical protein
LRGHGVLLHLPGGGPDGPAVQGGRVWHLDSDQQVNICIKSTFIYLCNLSHAGALKHVVDYEEGGTISRILHDGEEEERDDVVIL